MKNKIKYILLIVIFLFINFSIISNAETTIININCPDSIIIGETFSISLNLPENAYAAEADVTIKYKDGSIVEERLVFLTGMSNFPNSIQVDAKVVGTTEIKFSNIIISDQNAQLIETEGEIIKHIENNYRKDWFYDRGKKSC